MPVCSTCGATNRGEARFCYQCAAPLNQPRPLLDVRPSSDDRAWLAATLVGVPVVGGEYAGESGAQDGGGAMVQSQDNAESKQLVGGRYEVVSQNGAEVEAIDRQPWRRCWSCGATGNEAGELFCTECGASLEGRRYRGQLASAAIGGLALVSAIEDLEARAILPPIWDQVQDGDQLLTLAGETGRAAVVVPLDDLDAMYVGRGLARLLMALHKQGLTLGVIDPDDVEMTAARVPQLRVAPGLRRIKPDDVTAITDDLKGLATLLEALTSTPRTTQRLDESQALDASIPGVGDVLRAVRTGKLADGAALAERFDALIADRTQPVPLLARVGAASHVGMVRELDEDSLLTIELRMVQNSKPRTWGLYIVADGMGGHSAGEVASGLAILGAYETVQSAYLATALDLDGQDEDVRLREVVRKAILRANEYVLREAHNRGNDMGTTITMALVAGDRAVIGNIGDSRTYLYRDGALRRISKDHSLVMRLVDLGQITDEDVYSHPQRNAVLRSLGDKAEIEIDLFSERLRPGDALFLCCDGQWEMVRDPQMAKIIQTNADPQAACDTLITAANAAGGDDNITAVLVQFEAYGH